MKPATYYQAIRGPRWYLQPGLLGVYPHIWRCHGVDELTELAWSELDAGYAI